MQAQLWGKAQRYLEACLKLSALPEAYAELGILLEKIDQLELSNQYFRKGLIQFVPIELTSVATHVKFPEKI
jgi:HemY protein